MVVYNRSAVVIGYRRSGIDYIRRAMRACLLGVAIDVGMRLGYQRFLPGWDDQPGRPTRFDCGVKMYSYPLLAAGGDCDGCRGRKGVFGG